MDEINFSKIDSWQEKQPRNPCMAVCDCVMRRRVQNGGDGAVVLLGFLGEREKEGPIEVLLRKKQPCRVF